MGEVEKLMADRAPGGMPSPQDFRTAFDNDVRQMKEKPTMQWLAFIPVGACFVFGFGLMIYAFFS